MHVPLVRTPRCAYCGQPGHTEHCHCGRAYPCSEHHTGRAAPITERTIPAAPLISFGDIDISPDDWGSA